MHLKLDKLASLDVRIRLGETAAQLTASSVVTLALSDANSSKRPHLLLSKSMRKIELVKTQLNRDMKIATNPFSCLVSIESQIYSLVQTRIHPPTVKVHSHKVKLFPHSLPIHSPRFTETAANETGGKRFTKNFAKKRQQLWPGGDTRVQAASYSRKY